MKRSMTRVVVATILMVVGIPLAWAGSAHFISVDVTRSGDSLLVSGKEAGLGDLPQVDIQVSAIAECINPGDHHPKAANKQSVSATGSFPVQNGHADFSLALTPQFQPSCDPPMTVVFTDVVVQDLTNGVSVSVNGTF